MSDYYIYVISRRGTHGLCGPVKIGISSNPLNRLSTLQTACPFKIDIGFMFLCPNRQSAREVNCFSEYIKGEEAFKLWNSLRQLFEKGNKKEFVDLAVEIYNSHRRIGQGETK